MRREECLVGASPPNEARGAERSSGGFLRCLKGREVTKRYGDDRDVDPEFGWRLRPEKWRWKDSDGEEGLSCNLEGCFPCATCSISVHPAASQYRHVVTVDIEALSSELGMSVIAQYDPVSEEGQENPCHFNLLPEDEDIDDFLEALTRILERVWPKKFPRDQQNRSTAFEAKRRFELVFQLSRDALP